MTEYEKMLAGKIYRPADSEANKLAHKMHDLVTDFNKLYDTDPKRQELLDKIFPQHKGDIYVTGNLYVDYGVHTKIGDNFYANYGLTILDVCPVEIGDNCFFGPNVSLLTPLHPLRYQERNQYYDEELKKVTDREYGAPIKIGDNCWFGGNVIVLPGVTIGNGCVIGAGSVVTHDIPDNYLAYGNPCKAIREITEEDTIYNKKELW
ncbi:MAG: sugar O-acetyltransferase [Acholeplasmatales bacterium]|nr:sugar O-acetyltransferase [Acholeplasmatales bacterium]